MALKIYKKIKHNNVVFNEGYCYRFNYAAFENDPQPLIFFINAIKGIHPRTGHQWRLMQGININYIPRKDRRRFVDTWRKEIEKGKGIEFSWKRIERQFPYIRAGIRRYMLKPNYYMRNVEEIPISQWETEVVRSWSKDFSVSLKRAKATLFKRLFTGFRRR